MLNAGTQELVDCPACAKHAPMSTFQQPSRPKIRIVTLIYHVLIDRKQTWPLCQCVLFLKMTRPPPNAWWQPHCQQYWHGVKITRFNSCSNLRTPSRSRAASKVAPKSASFVYNERTPCFLQAQVIIFPFHILVAHVNDLRSHLSAAKLALLYDHSIKELLSE